MVRYSEDRGTQDSIDWERQKETEMTFFSLFKPTLNNLHPTQTFNLYIFSPGRYNNCCGCLCQQVVQCVLIIQVPGFGSKQILFSTDSRRLWGATLSETWEKKNHFTRQSVLVGFFHSRYSTCHSKKSTGVSININDDSVLFKCPMTMWQWQHTSLSVQHQNPENEWKSSFVLLLFTPVPLHPLHAWSASYLSLGRFWW